MTVKRRKLKSKYTYLISVLNLIAAGVVTVAFFIRESDFNVLKPGGFFTRISLLHIVWLIWFVEIILKFVPIRAVQSTGADKLFAYSYIPTGKDTDNDAFRAFKKKSRVQAGLMALLWFGCVSICGGLTAIGFFNYRTLMLLCAWLYVSDNFFLSIDCPFRVIIMKNRCCRTCRIHDWDRLMTLSPLFFVPGFFSLSLIIPSAVLFILWEASYNIHPERFWEGTNAALRCAECKEKSCEMYLDRKHIDK